MLCLVLVDTYSRCNNAVPLDNEDALKGKRRSTCSDNSGDGKVRLKTDACSSIMLLEDIKTTNGP